jgi:hypothetical protein
VAAAGPGLGRAGAERRHTGAGALATAVQFIQQALELIVVDELVHFFFD